MSPTRSLCVAAALVALTAAGCRAAKPRELLHTVTLSGGVFEVRGDSFAVANERFPADRVIVPVVRATVSIRTEDGQLVSARTANDGSYSLAPISIGGRDGDAFQVFLFDRPGFTLLGLNVGEPYGLKDGASTLFIGVPPLRPAPPQKPSAAPATHAL